MNKDITLFAQLSPLDLGKILNRWREPHRRWHGLRHLSSLLLHIESEPDMDDSDREMLRYVALFHDAIYSPDKEDNEEESAQLAVFYLGKYERRDEVVAAILATKTYESCDPLSQRFNEWDCGILQEEDWTKLLEYEEAIAYEYGQVSPEKYRSDRERFLEKAAIDFRNPSLVRLAKHVAHELTFSQMAGR